MKYKKVLEEFEKVKDIDFETIMCSRVRRERCDDPKFSFTNIYSPPKVFVELSNEPKKVYEFTSPYEAKHIRIKKDMLEGKDISNEIGV